MFVFVSPEGIEPSTRGLRDRCSTSELRARFCFEAGVCLSEP